MRLFLGVLILTPVTACSGPTVDSTGDNAATRQILPLRNIEINLDFPAYLKGGTYSFHDERGEYLVILDSALTTLNFVDIFKGEVDSRYAVDSIFDLFAHQYSFSLFVKSRDSVYFLLDNSAVVRANLENGSYESWKIDAEFENYPDYMIYGKGTTAEFTVHNNMLITAPIIQSIDVRTAESRRKFYSYPSHFAIELLPAGKYKLDWVGGQHPKHLREGISYKDEFPRSSIVTKNNILLSYDNDPKVRVHSATTGELLKSVDAHAEGFVTLHPFNDDSVAHTQHTKEYLIEKSSYRRLIHNSFNGSYYRQHWQGATYERTQYEVNGLDDKPWSIVVLNDNYERTAEYQFESGKEYFFGTMIPTSEGLLLVKTKNKSSNKLTYGLFEL